MDENMKKEIENGASVLEITQEDAMAKYEDLCQQNGIETSDRLGLGLWRNFVANAKRSKKGGDDTSSSSDSYYKKAFGFFIALEAPRDTLSWNRNKAKEEYLRDADAALENGIVAVANENAIGKWSVSRYFNGEYQERVVSNLPEGAETLEDGRIYIPLDSNATWMSGAKNNNYGKPLAKELFRRSGIFYGSLNGGEMQTYNFSYKNQAGVDFTPNTFEWVHFLCVANDNGKDLYGAKELTLDSLTLNSDIDPENDMHKNTDDYDFTTILQQNLDSHLVPLVDLDREHIQRQGLPNNERFIITDGTVCNMNMTPTKNGNRIINITDLNAELDYENDSGMVTCWIPSHIGLDFGIGSSVIVVGRTSQRTIDGDVEPVTINASGLLCTEKHGSSVEISQPVEEDFDWF